MAAHCSGCMFTVCVFTAVCVYTLDGSNAEHKFWVWVTILGRMSRHFHSWDPESGNRSFIDILGTAGSWASGGTKTKWNKGLSTRPSSGEGRGAVTISRRAVSSISGSTVSGPLALGPLAWTSHDPETVRSPSSIEAQGPSQHAAYVEPPGRDHPRPVLSGLWPGGPAVTLWRGEQKPPPHKLCKHCQLGLTNTYRPVRGDTDHHAEW